MAKNQYCLGCKHYRSLYYSKENVTGSDLACHYILDVGHMRGCPFGKGCDKRDTSPRKRGAAAWQINL
jgi:hypothetical protein